MSILKFDSVEYKIDSWTVLYIPPIGGKYNGKLTVTNVNLFYEAKFNVSVIWENIFYAPSSSGLIVLPKKDILTTETQKNFLSKKIILTMKNGEKHIIDYGMLNIDKLVEAINFR